MSSQNLFEEFEHELRLGDEARVLRNFAAPVADELVTAITAIQSEAPFRHMKTPGGHTMSVALTNCGRLGWVTDNRGYRYTTNDPLTGRPWPDMPPVFRRLASDAAAAAGFSSFDPDACLINRYLPGARMSLHQDRNERDYSAPIVSVSLGMTATFLFGGLQRGDRALRVPVHHGDIVVWGGVDRLRYHGILPLKGDGHPLLGEQRLNFTFRQAG